MEKYGLAQKLGTDYPEFFQGLMEFVRAVRKGTALDAKTKQLILTGIAIASRNEDAAVYNIASALSKGATKEEILETCFLAALAGSTQSLPVMKVAIAAPAKAIAIPKSMLINLSISMPFLFSLQLQ